MYPFLIFLLIPFLVHCKYYSQCGQDKFVNENYFKGKLGGTFVDIGANDGISLSNSYFFEQELGWKGLCIEPIPETYRELKKNRKSICIHGCISDQSGFFPFVAISGPCSMLSGLLYKYDPRHLERIQREIALYGGSYMIFNVHCYLLNNLLDLSHITHIDFLSIDTEGGEFDILSSIDFSRFQIDVITVEDNFADPRFIPFLESHGYKFIQRLEVDLLFVHHSLL